MKSVKGTETEKNLLKAFAGESQARMRYTYFAKVAKQEGYEQIAAIFLETADQEKQHAKKYFGHLEGGAVEITATYPAGVISTTIQNLIEAAKGEHEEWTDLYPHFGDVAEAEGFLNIAATFRKIAAVEVQHEKRYLRLLARVEAGTVFSREEEVSWQCRECGHIHVGKEAPKACPTCAHVQAYFEIEKQNY
jgi:rubrerythrin